MKGRIIKSERGDPYRKGDIVNIVSYDVVPLNHGPGTKMYIMRCYECRHPQDDYTQSVMGDCIEIIKGYTK